jgi:predicted short-subunit dehydrogenase-like oxidoreductase (DUF2520 family)
VNKIEHISFIGAGNVATHLATGLHKKGIKIVQVWSGHAENAEILAHKTNARVCEHLNDLSLDADLVIVSVKDDVLPEVLSRLPAGIPAIVHTSGSLDMKLLNGKSNHIGVFYPLQSFNKNEEVDLAPVPICVEANSDDFTEQIFQLGHRLSENVQYINSTQRIQLHIAAVIANNFTNYLYSISYELVVKHHLPFSLLIPLIQRTVNRLGHGDPVLLQTGPAQRGDVELIKKHIGLLTHDPEIAEVYEFISDKIKKKAGN